MDDPMSWQSHFVWSQTHDVWAQRNLHIHAEMLAVVKDFLAAEQASMKILRTCGVVPSIVRVVYAIPRVPFNDEPWHSIVETPMGEPSALRPFNFARSDGAIRYLRVQLVGYAGVLVLESFPEVRMIFCGVETHVGFIAQGRFFETPLRPESLPPWGVIPFTRAN